MEIPEPFVTISTDFSIHLVTWHLHQDWGSKQSYLEISGYQEFPHQVFFFTPIQFWVI